MHKMLCTCLLEVLSCFSLRKQKIVRKTWAVVEGILNQYTVLPKSLMTYKKPRVYCYRFMALREQTVSHFKGNSKTCLFKISSPEVFLTDSILTCPLVHFLLPQFIYCTREVGSDLMNSCLGPEALGGIL